VRVFLETMYGPYAGKVIQLETGVSLRIGRSANADVIFADDYQLSPVHLAVGCDDRVCHLYDWNSGRGTFLNGERVYKAELANGDQIRVGRTYMTVHIETGEFRRADQDDRPETPLTRLLQILRSRSEPLFALVDAAQGRMAFEMLSDCQDECKSLFDGETAEDLAEVAPYLVAISNGSQFLEKLLYLGWGKSWGVFFTSAEPFVRIRKHLRYLQYVTDENQKEGVLYFRFYDPRVLRAFLQSPPRLIPGDFWGPFESFFVEAEQPLTLLEFTRQSRRRFQLTGAGHSFGLQETPTEK
jgi:Domain of unknown function (DUF4123)/FHA domain